MKTFFKYLGIGLLILIVVILVKTFTFKSKQMSEPQAKLLNLNDSCVARLQKAIQFKTISYDDANLMDTLAFADFHRFLNQAYPQVFTKLELEKVNKYSLVLHWKISQATTSDILFALVASGHRNAT